VALITNGRPAASDPEESSPSNAVKPSAARVRIMFSRYFDIDALFLYGLGGCLLLFASTNRPVQERRALVRIARERIEYRDSQRGKVSIRLTIVFDVAE
jgi:hypothetical protein